MAKEVMDRFVFGFMYPDKTESDYQKYLREVGAVPPLPEDSIETQMEVSKRLEQLTPDERLDAVYLARMHGKDKPTKEELDFLETDEYKSMVTERNKLWQQERERKAAEYKKELQELE